MYYLRKDMQFQHYRWTDIERADTLFTGEPSRRVFDRWDGEQVLFVINYYLSFLGKATIVEARGVENKIAHFLPLGSKSERSVLNWLITNMSLNK